jgi:hypothetical protein
VKEKTMNRVCELLVICLLILFTGVVSAVPSDEALAPFKKKLSKKIPLQLLGTPLERVLEHLELKADCPIIIDRIALGSKKLKQKITLEMKSITVKKALDTVCSIADIDYDVRMKHLFVSTKREILKPYLVTKFYDIRALTIIPQDMPGPDIELMSGEGDVAITPFAGGEKVDLIGVSPEGMKHFIQSAYPKANWDVRGVSLEFRGATLAVTNTQEVQDSIKQLFLEQQKAYGKMVEFDIQVLNMNTALIDNFFNKKESNILSEKELT